MRLLRVVLPMAILLAMLPLGASPAQAEVNVYTTPGTHHVNGRQWNTTCEKYSQTYRCRTNIQSTRVVYQGGLSVTA